VFCLLNYSKTRGGHGGGTRTRALPGYSRVIYP
jgi:hypothetical protein